MTQKTILKILTWTCTLCLIVSHLSSQDISVVEETAPLNSVHKFVLPVQDNEQLRHQYKFYEPNKAGVLHTFAEALTTDINCNDHGTWESTKDGNLLWRQRIISEGAYSVNLGFTDFFLPSSASLFVSDPNRTVIIGPLTKEDNDSHGQWWSPVIPGEEVVIELQIAPEHVEKLVLKIGKVNHDFSGFGALLSGSCNVDVVCGEADGLAVVDKYRDVINSVGQMMINGQFQCTGSLVNNTRNDCTPYVITAEHCGITTSNASSVVLYWNFQNSQCRTPGSLESGNPGDGNRVQFNSGSSLVAKYDQSDFSMVLLDDPVDPNFNPFFLGWDRAVEEVDTAAVVHHPRGDEKRISFDYGSPIFNFDRNFLRIENWEVGTTESGSSGSPLVTTEGLVIGYLSGGDAACGNNLEDDFGMFKSSWEGGGTPETRLKDWLDPINTGQVSINGRNCSDLAILDANDVSICAVENPQGRLQLTATNGYDLGGTLRTEDVPQELQVSFSKEEIFNGETVDILFDADQTGQNSIFEIKLIVENDLGLTEYFITVSIFNSTPTSPTLTLPLDGAQGLNFDVPLSWSDNSDIQLYEVEISLRSDFSSLDRSFDNLSEANFILSDLEATTTYYWRIKGINKCGQGQYSTIRSFTTGTIVCESFSPPDLPISIGTDPVTITSSINVESNGTIADVKINNLAVTHSWITDLTISIISPSGTEVFLIETPCNGESNIRASFDDESNLVNLDCPLTLGNIYRPLQSLAAFDDEDPNGIWTLKVEDAISEDGGSLDGWSLELCLNKETSSKSLISDSSFIEVCDKSTEPIDLILTLSGVWNNPSAAVVTTGSGMSIAASTSPDPVGTATEIVVSIADPSLLNDRDQLTVSIMDGEDIITRNIEIIHTSDVVTPTLTSPAEGATNVALNPELSWTESLSIDGSYVVTLSDNQNLSNPIGTFNSPSNNLIIANELEGLTIYYWQVTAQGVCADSSSLVGSFMTDVKVSTVDQTLAGARIFPSPANHTVFLDLQDLGSKRDLSYELVTLSGQIVSRGDLVNQVSEIPVSSLSEGLYLISLISPEGLYTHKIVVSR